MLTDVSIEGLRGVGKVELHFAPEQRVYALFGANGVGKTKCLEALYQSLLVSSEGFARHITTRREARDGGARQVSSEGSVGHISTDWYVMDRMRSVSNEITFEIFRGDKYGAVVWNVYENARMTYVHRLPVVFLGAGQRTNLGNEKSLSVSPLGLFAERQKKYFARVLSSLQSGRLSSLGMSGDTRAWFVERKLSAALDDKDNRLVEIETVLSMLNAVDQRINPDPKSLVVDGNFKVSLEVDGNKLELGELSSGFAALLKMIQAIVAGYAAFTNEVQLQDVRGVVLIDEIDAHLHAEWQVKIIPCLKKLLPNTTFFVATHSPLVLVRLKQKEAYLLKRDDDGVVRSNEVSYPNRRLFIDVLEDGFGVDLNKLKRDGLVDDDQSDVKARLLQLLREQWEEEA